MQAISTGPADGLSQADRVDVLIAVLATAVDETARGASFAAVGALLAYDAALRLRPTTGGLSARAEDAAARITAEAAGASGLLEAALGVAAEVPAEPGVGRLVADLGDLLREADADDDV